MDRPPWQGPRGLLAGVICAAGTTWAHTSLSGHPVGGIGVLVLAAVALASVVGCLLLASRRIGLPGLVLLGVTGQGAAHAAMALAMPAGHAMAPGHAGQDAVAQQLVDGGLPMLLAHAAVALVTAALARCGDGALLELARQAVARLLPALPAALALPAPVDRPAAYVVRLGTGRRVEAAPGSRGPPAAAFPRPC